MNIVRMKQIWEYNDQSAVVPLPHGYRITMDGEINYWLSLDRALQYWDTKVGVSTKLRFFLQNPNFQNNNYFHQRPNNTRHDRFHWKRRKTPFEDTRRVEFGPPYNRSHLPTPPPQ